MESLQEEGDYGTIKQRIRGLESEKKSLKRKLEVKKNDRNFKIPFRWNLKFMQQKRKRRDEILCIYLTKKNTIQGPKYTRVFPGNIVVWKNMSYKYTPKALWRWEIRGYPTVYIIREIDRLPVSNQDYNKLRGMPRSPENDPILLKMLLQAKVQAAIKNVNKTALVIGGLVLVGGIIWFLSS